MLPQRAVEGRTHHAGPSAGRHLGAGDRRAEAGGARLRDQERQRAERQRNGKGEGGGQDCERVGDREARVSLAGTYLRTDPSGRTRYLVVY